MILRPEYCSSDQGTVISPTKSSSNQDTDRREGASFIALDHGLHSLFPLSTTYRTVQPPGARARASSPEHQEAEAEAEARARARVHMTALITPASLYVTCLLPTAINKTTHPFALLNKLQSTNNLGQGEVKCGSSLRTSPAVERHRLREIFHRRHGGRIKTPSKIFRGRTARDVGRGHFPQNMASQR